MADVYSTKTPIERLHELQARWDEAFQWRDWQTCEIVNDQINDLRNEVLVAHGYTPIDFKKAATNA